jgi:hypothetical protein
MELFGIILSVPVAFVMSMVYCFFWPRSCVSSTSRVASYLRLRSLFWDCSRLNWCCSLCSVRFAVRPLWAPASTPRMCSSFFRRAGFGKRACPSEKWCHFRSMVLRWCYLHCLRVFPGVAAVRCLGSTLRNRRNQWTIQLAA